MDDSVPVATRPPTVTAARPPEPGGRLLGEATVLWVIWLTYGPAQALIVYSVGVALMQIR